MALPIGWSQKELDDWFADLSDEAWRAHDEAVRTRSEPELQVNVEEWLATGATTSPLPRAWSMKEFTDLMTSLAGSADAVYRQYILSRTPPEIYDDVAAKLWAPADLGASLLACWDAERLDLITRDGNGAVSAWRDTKNGYELTQLTGTAQPAWSASSFGGRPGITPDGVDDFLELGSSPAWLPAGAAPSEDWYLVDQPTLPADTALYALGAWGSTANSNSRTVFRTVVTGVNRATGNVSVGVNNTLVDFSGRHVVRAVVTATGHTIEVDGLAPAETATVPATIAARIRTFAGATVAAASFGKTRLNARIITGPLSVAQASQLRAYLSARMPAFDPDVVSYAAAVNANGGTVSSARAAQLSTLVAAWRSAGVWDLIDDAWMLVAENVPQALTSFKQRRLATAMLAPTFTVDRGYGPFNGTTQYIDTLFVPSIHKVAMTGTNMHISAYERTHAGGSTFAAGSVIGSTQNLLLGPRNTTNFMVVQLNSQSTGPGGDAIITDSRGFAVASRNGTLAADILAYKNGIAVAPQQPGTLGSTLPTVKLFIGAQCNASSVATGFRAATQGFVSVGAGIPAASQPAFYNALQSFMTAVGAQV